MSFKRFLTIDLFEGKFKLCLLLVVPKKKVGGEVYTVKPFVPQ